MSLLTTLRRRRWAVATGAALAMLAVAACAAWCLPAWRTARDTRQALSAGRYSDAWSASGRWLKIRPHSAEAHYYRAKTAIALGRRRDILDGLKQAQEFGCPEDQIEVLRALLDAQAGRLAQAKPVLARAFANAVAPDLMLDEALARVYLETYDFSHAGAVLDRWAKDDPHDPRPPFWHASAHLRLNAEPTLLIADYRETLRRAPDHAEARRGLAEQLFQANRNREAAEAYTAFLALRPNDAAGHRGAGRNALVLDDEAAAVHHLDRALALDPDDAAAHLERAKIDLRRKAPQAALAHLERAVARAPFDPAIHYQYSLALKRLGRDDDAQRELATFTRLQRDRRQLDDLQESLAESPGNAGLQNQIAHWMFDHGYVEEGVIWAKKILADHPGHPDTCLLLAGFYENQGQVELSRFYRSQSARRPPR